MRDRRARTRGEGKWPAAGYRADGGAVALVVVLGRVFDGSRRRATILTLL